MVKEPPSFEFGDFVADPRTMQIRCAGQSLEIEPKCFKVLIFLIENRDRVVTKEELFAAVWQGAFVTDNALTRVIAQLRRTLGDNAKQARYIETVPTVGYRFIAEVRLAKVLAAPAPAALNVAPTAPVALALAMLAVIAAGLAIAYWHRSLPAGGLQGGARSLLQFTTSTGLDQHPSFSPDSSMIAYASDRSGRFEIYVEPTAPGGREVQVTNDGGQNLEPAWSPDGRWIAYWSAARGGIWVIPALGGVPRKLTDFGAEPAWSPDSSQIAFQSNAPPSLAMPDVAPMQPSRILVVPLQGGAPTSLSDGVAGRQVQPAWSPDGRWVAYLNLGSRQESGLWALPVGGGSAVRLVGTPRCFNPVFAADGRGLYYATVSGSSAGIWRAPLDPKRMRVLGPSVEIQRSGLALPLDLALSSSGSRLAYTVASMNSDLWSLSLGAPKFEPRGEPTLLTRDTSYRKFHPVFSPDGSRIAYFLQRRGVLGDIWMMDADGGHPVQITSQPTLELMPSWLPDSSGIVYVALRQGRHSLWMTSLSDHSEKHFADLPEAVGAGLLSPDGKEVVSFGPSTGLTNVQKVTLADGKNVQLTFDKEGAGFGCWSPDSKWIAFEVQRGLNTQLAIVPRQGGSLIQLTNDDGRAWPFGWSPDTDKIAYAGLRNGAWNLYWISRSTREIRQLTRHESLRTFVRYPSWSPRGDQLVYEFAEMKGNIFLVDVP